MRFWLACIFQFIAIGAGDVISAASATPSPSDVILQKLPNALEDDAELRNLKMVH